MKAISVVARPFMAVGAAITAGSSMVWGRMRSWGVYLARTRIDYRTEIGDPLTNSIVGAVVGWIARNFPDAPVRIVKEDDPAAAPILRSSTGPGAMLRLLERPNPFYSGVLQWQATVVDFVARGDAYWLKVRSDSDRVVELWWVPYRMMEPRWPETDPTVFISHYDYKVDGEIYQVKPRDVVHFRNGIDPWNPRKGLSPLGSLLREIFTDDEAAQFTASLLRNLGVPGVVIAPSNTAGSQRIDADPGGVKKKWMDTFGGDNRGEPVVFTAPTDVKVLSFNPQQMDLKALRRIPEERVSARLGVPPGVTNLGAGLDRNTFTNLAEANVSAMTQGVIPLHRLIGAELEVQLLPEFVGGAELLTLDVVFDALATQAMRGAFEAIWKLNEAAATKGLVKRSEFRRAVRLPVTEADDVYIMANNYATTKTGNPPQLRSVPTGPGQLGEPADEEAAVAVAVDLAPLRCSGTFRDAPCDALLADAAAPGTRIVCRRCKATTEAA